MNQNKALEIAYKAYIGQLDKGGSPYILHLVRVALHCQTEDEKIVALLHDVVEDTSITFEDLKMEGLDDRLLEALKCLTKEAGEDYKAFIERVSTNRLATKVKIQDLKDNMDVIRLNSKVHWKLETYKEALEYLEQCSNKKVLYVDMDNVLVNFQSGIDALNEELKSRYAGCYDEVPNIFAKMQPNEGAIDAMNRLKDKYDIYILSTAPWDNPSAWSDKLEWVKRYLGEVCYKRLILSHHKNLNAGDYLIDDRKKNGAADFKGELILFGSERFPNWESVVRYLLW